MSARADVIVIGGGIIGLATAWRITRRFPDRRLILVEKEPEVARHQSGNNSGVLHSGIYYRPGSLKAENCRDGRRAMVDFCEREGIPYEICGKVIVATEESELPALERILERGLANGVRCEEIDTARLRELEPHVAGVRAIQVPEAGIVDYVEVSRRLARHVEESGGRILTGTRVTSLKHTPEALVVATTSGDLEAAQAVNCAGLYSDRLARLAGENPPARIVPFRGEYYELKPEARHLCRNLIYPVPDPRFPFLGVHFTRMVRGGVECGPNAVLAFAREGYTRSRVNLRDTVESLTYPGFLRLAARYWRTGLGEMWRSFSLRAFTRALQRLVPGVREDHLIPAPAGVRAQALAPDGTLVDDFLILEGERMLHVCNAPSPGATASLNIGRLIADRLESRFS